MLVFINTGLQAGDCAAASHEAVSTASLSTKRLRQRAKFRMIATNDPAGTRVRYSHARKNSREQRSHAARIEKCAGAIAIRAFCGRFPARSAPLAHRAT